jgi:hypothetical protein
MYVLCITPCTLFYRVHLHTLLHFPIHNTLFSHILSTTRILLPTRIPLLILTHPYAYCRSWLMM